MFQNKVLSFSMVSGRSWLQFTSVHCGPALQSNENMPSSLIHMSWQMAAILIAALKKMSVEQDLNLWLKLKARNILLGPKHKELNLPKANSQLYHYTMIILSK